MTARSGPKAMGLGVIHGCNSFIQQLKRLAQLGAQHFHSTRRIRQPSGSTAAPSRHTRRICAQVAKVSNHLLVSRHAQKIRKIDRVARGCACVLFAKQMATQSGCVVDHCSWLTSAPALYARIGSASARACKRSGRRCTRGALQPGRTEPCTVRLERTPQASVAGRTQLLVERLVHGRQVPYERLRVITGGAYMARRVWRPCKRVDRRSVPLQLRDGQRGEPARRRCCWLWVHDHLPRRVWATEPEEAHCRQAVTRPA